MSYGILKGDSDNSKSNRGNDKTVIIVDAIEDQRQRKASLQVDSKQVTQ
ncbi:MAG: hypothetical protein ACI9SC_001321 [Gammaproteobacteria bacterium]|jgi:hypothetical protein